MSNLVIVGAGDIGVSAAVAAVSDGVADGIAAIADPDAAARERLRDSHGAVGYADTSDLPPARQGDRAIVSFSSSAERVAPEIVSLVTAGYHVVTTCEELAWPPRHIWEAMHTTAMSQRRVIIVTGANPGFVMDRFPLLVAGASRNVRAIRLERRVDTARRRRTLVEKTGRGLDIEHFRTGVASGELGHKGLVASGRLLAHALGWPQHDASETIEPVVDEEGTVSGIHHHAEIRSGDGRSITLDLWMAWQLDRAGDAVVIDGEPPLEVRIEGGYHGDAGTIAQVGSALARCTKLDPGFYRPTDLPLRLS